MRAIALLSLVGALHAAGPVDYVPRHWVSGHLRCVGSETMDILLARWAEAFSRFHPAWTLEVDGKGSRVALRALARTGADLAALSRIPHDSEFAVAGMPRSARPTLIVVGWDTLRFLWRRGTEIDTGAIRKAYLGAAGWLRPIGRNLSSGTREEVRSALGVGREFGSGVRSLPSPSQLAQAVADDPRAVGYGGAGWAFSRLEMKGPLIEVRPLVLAVPAGPIRPSVAEFLSYVLSSPGQDLVGQAGFCRIAPDSALAWRRRLGL